MAADPSSCALAAAKPRVLPALLCVDAAVELAVGVLLLAAPGWFAGAYAIPVDAAAALGAVFLLAAAAVAAIAARPERMTVRLLAAANATGGLLGWAAWLAAWPTIEPSGRWLAAALCDTFIALGALEWLALRSRVPSPRAS
jgi:hypothetical protein